MIGHYRINDGAISITTQGTHHSHLKMTITNDHMITEKVRQELRGKVDEQKNPKDSKTGQQGPIWTGTTLHTMINNDRITPGSDDHPQDNNSRQQSPTTILRQTLETTPNDLLVGQ